MSERGKWIILVNWHRHDFPLWESFCLFDIGWNFRPDLDPWYIEITFFNLILTIQTEPLRRKP